MARYMLDTNMCIYLMKNQPAQVARRFAACYVGDVVMSAITYAELDYGVTVSADSARHTEQLAALIVDVPVAPFDKEAASAYGAIRAASPARAQGQLDKLIGAHAVALDVVLVTNNERDFANYPRLTIENWITVPPP